MINQTILLYPLRFHANALSLDELQNLKPSSSDFIEWLHNEEIAKAVLKKGFKKIKCHKIAKTVKLIEATFYITSDSI